MALTSSIVNMYITDNATWQDALQFGTPGDTTWSFTGMKFIVDIKASRNDVTPLLTVSSDLGSIVVDDPVNRILHFNVPDSVIQASLPCAVYDYDLIMFDTSDPPIRTQLMMGQLIVRKGVTEE